MSHYSKKQLAEFMSPQYLKIAQDCARLVNTTKNPDVFFPRYKLLIEKMEQLSDFEKVIKFSGTKPSKELAEIKRKRDIATHDFLVRYYSDTRQKIKSAKTPKSKYNNAEKFNSQVSIYICELSKSNIEEFNRMSSELYALCEKAELVSKRTDSPKQTKIEETTTLSNSSGIPGEVLSWPWYISISFGRSSSNNFDKALFLAKAANYYLEDEMDGNRIYQAFFKSDPADYLKFVQLYELVGAWKSSCVIINGKIVDRKIIGGLNYCYGDRCRTGRSDFCFGASPATRNPFGCHRLQMSASNTPWWSFSHFDGANYVIDKSAIRMRAETFSTAYRLCPCFDTDYVNNAINELPPVLTKMEFEEVTMQGYFSAPLKLFSDLEENYEATNNFTMCPNCQSNDTYPISDEMNLIGCAKVVFYLILLFIPIIGWIAIYQSIKSTKRKKESVSYRKCKKCGKKFKVNNL